MDPIVIPVMALMIPIIVVPTTLFFKHRLRVREMQHNERMRAMELGVMPRTESMSWPGAAVCVALGAGVPVGSLVVAWLATMTNDAPSEVWGVPVVISFFAIWAAQALAERMLRPKKERLNAANTSQTEQTAGKPAFDPDAYDVVGSRG